MAGADIGDPRVRGCSKPLKATGRDEPARCWWEQTVICSQTRQARLLSRRRLTGRSRGGVGSSFTSGGSSVTRGSGRVGGSFASLGSGVASSSGGVSRLGGRFLSGFSRSFFLLGASGEGQRQSQSSENHFDVHMNDHPNVMIG